MRLFTGIEIPEDVKNRLELLIERLRPTANLKWSPVHNLHITTKFIGEWSSSRLDELAFALREVTGPGPIEVEISGLGWFPNPQNPRVFWAGIQSGVADLAEVANATESALERLGIAREDRPFAPHLTLARVRQPVGLNAMRQALANLDSSNFGKFAVSQFHLYLSEPGSSGSVYTKLYDFPLARA